VKRPAHLIARAVVAVLIVGLEQLAGLRIAPADEAEEPVRLLYQAASGCPDEASFVARIRARSPRARVAWHGEAALFGRVANMACQSRFVAAAECSRDDECFATTGFRVRFPLSALPCSRSRRMRERFRAPASDNL
jgi:hypothetical protein